jgi:hypothetical protein
VNQFHAPISEIRLALENRGLLLREPAREKSIAHFREIFPKLAEPFFDIFKQFDGFETGQVDGASVIEIWGIDKIISVANSSNACRSDCIAFGDFMMGSENICCSIYNLENPVFFDESREVFSNSYFEFWYKICSGEFDFN